jgi:hypothetical protein
VRHFQTQYPPVEPDDPEGLKPPAKFAITITIGRGAAAELDAAIFTPTANINIASAAARLTRFRIA